MTRLSAGAATSWSDRRKSLRNISPVLALVWKAGPAGVVRGRRLTSWPSLKTDLQNAGAEWIDEAIVADNGLVTSRKPGDIPEFNRRMIEEFRHAGAPEPLGANRRS